MTYKEYINSPECDELQRAIIIINIGRQIPQDIPIHIQRKMMNKILNKDINDNLY